MEYNKQISEKLNNDLKEYVKELKEKSVDDILMSAYELTMKTEMIYSICDRDFTKEEAKAILKTPNALDTFYREWLQFDSNFDELFEYPIEKNLHNLVQDMKHEKIKKGGAR